MAAVVLWRRLDTPGHDACRLERNDTGWQLDGTAVFREDGAPVQLAYRVLCDPSWRTLQGRRSEASYWYEAPSVGYSCLLEVTPTGFIRRYPGLWEMEP